MKNNKFFIFASFLALMIFFALLPFLCLYWNLVFLNNEIKTASPDQFNNDPQYDTSDPFITKVKK